MDYVLLIFLVVNINCGPPTPVSVWYWLTYSEKRIACSVNKTSEQYYSIIIIPCRYYKETGWTFRCTPTLIYEGEFSS